MTAPDASAPSPIVPKPSGLPGVLIRNYHQFLPGVVLGWFALLVDAPHVAVVLAAVCGSLLMAGAARALGLRPESTLRLGLERGPYHVALVTVMIGAVFVLGVAAAGITAILRARAAPLAGPVGTGVFVLAAGALLARFWPVYATPFLFEGRWRWHLVPTRGGFSGPSFVAAWRMTGVAGAFACRTLPLFGWWAIGIGAGAGLAWFGQHRRFAALVPIAWIALVAPLLHLVAARTAETLRRDSRLATDRP